MKLHVPILRLGRVDHQRLTTQVEETAPECWTADTRRQDLFHEYHGQTQSIILMFCEGWPTVKGTREPEAWSRYGDATADVIFDVLRRHYSPGGLLLRVILAKLPAGGRIKRHKDSHPSFEIAHRIHVPLVTNAGVRFMVGDAVLPPEAGVAFEIDNLLAHEVSNYGDEDRIHLIFDYAPPDRLRSRR
jgi:hypothetical protein